MEIKSSVHQIQITSEECYEIACWIYSSLEHSVKTHYVKHPEVYQQQESGRLKMMEKFFALSAYPHLYNFHKATLEGMLVKKD